MEVLSATPAGGLRPSLQGKIEVINPVADPRWAELVERHPQGSAFHTPAWILALQQTYAYTPKAWALPGQDGRLEAGIVACHVASPLTGSRLVSVPFSDHCDPLVNSSADLKPLVDAMRTWCDATRIKYMELRPKTLAESLAGDPSDQFHFHQLDLNRPFSEIERGLHADCIRRKIRRAEREGIVQEVGTSETMVQNLYRLLAITRRRHGVPPPPFRWFKNVIATMGSLASIRLAYIGGRAVAGILLLQYKDTLIYKYGGSEAGSHSAGSMQFLLWEAIQQGHAAGLRLLDLGRTDFTDPGVAAFKDRWGAVRSTLCYWRYPATRKSRMQRSGVSRAAHKVCGWLPEPLFRAAGSWAYRHMA